MALIKQGHTHVHQPVGGAELKAASAI
jgi:hypothetical protein